MTRLCSVLAAAWLAGAAVGQQPYPYPGAGNGLPYYPPPANTGSIRPPLSPYLNLLNGNNPALNYYYGVQPYTNPNTFGGFGGGGYGFGARGPLFVQPVPPEPEVVPEPDDVKKFRLPSPGNPVVFGNRFGNSRAGIVGPQQAGFGAGGMAQGGVGGQAGRQPTIGQGQAAPNTIPRSR